MGQESSSLYPAGRPPAASPREGVQIVQIRNWPAEASEELLAESEQEGFRFVRRAKEEWLSGVNTFSKKGEAFFGIFDDSRLLAIGGINCGSDRLGRLRRCYVCRKARRQGLGRQLVQHILAFAQPHYSQVGLCCDTDAADRFYRAVGVAHTNSVQGVTHIIELRQAARPPLQP